MNQHCYTIARLRPTGGLAIFGLLKVHIAGILLTVLVEDPLLANIQKYIACLISPLSGQTHSHDKNSKHFKEHIKNACALVVRK